MLLMPFLFKKKTICVYPSVYAKYNTFVNELFHDDTCKQIYTKPSSHPIYTNISDGREKVVKVFIWGMTQNSFTRNVTNKFIKKKVSSAIKM